uniref:Uncharacterized protein n=1 Tax=Glossina pallidipes TaxID=7398 RepID=A0A1B0AHL8_GLOPL
MSVKYCDELGDVANISPHLTVVATSCIEIKCKCYEFPSGGELAVFLCQLFLKNFHLNFLLRKRAHSENYKFITLLTSVHSTSAYVYHNDEVETLHLKRFSTTFGISCYKREDKALLPIYPSMADRKFPILYDDGLGDNTDDDDDDGYEDDEYSAKGPDIYSAV